MMRRHLVTPDSDVVSRQLRLIVILDGAERVGLTPLDVLAVHTVAYFTDALAPVWHLPIMNAQTLKRTRPYYPALQDDLDGLVGRGVVKISALRDSAELGVGRRPRGNYRLNRQFADPILSVAGGFEEKSREMTFIREVVYAASGLGIENLDRATDVDALYGDDVIAIGGLVDVANDFGTGPNASAAVALRFGVLVDPAGGLTPAEMLHLYVRQLYSRMTDE